MFERYIIVSKGIGVYLGSCLGFYFWSKIDAVGQDSAIAFPTIDAARNFLNAYSTKFPVGDFVSIKKVITSNEYYASIAECVAVGVPDWSEQLKRGDFLEK
ncbi:hypothetical protein Ga0466249_005336 [Sporomusaceae bacterium BoRhaA]|uniref:hypothetical protein n=1 Tax=Pelorhabdus rhamnosifermentans TaxID=2772457 RepID=UPI001C05FD75|nr:hypothetical protein [Pelorhabdus rhamnosifermentans]MBU2704182.1 hypothetical protein [Pelorhabdus rhamnosifermentans]